MTTMRHENLDLVKFSDFKVKWAYRVINTLAAALIAGGVGCSIDNVARFNENRIHKQTLKNSDPNSAELLALESSQAENIKGMAAGVAIISLISVASYLHRWSRLSLVPKE